jgi:hypothetical protein
VIGRPEFELTSQADCDAIVKQYPLPDVVINTVGVIANDLWASMLINFVAPSYITMKYVQILDKGHIINISGVTACTLAHGLKGPVIEHPFFGTQAVVEDLKKCAGWSVGRPVYKNLQVRRENGVIVEWFDAP